jgi:NAD(P)-dependent dehydrogenase (short-subunit alcohol dehydrogenase family)
MPGKRATTPDVLLVTGGSSGIGLALAREAAKRGSRLALLARGREGLDQAAQACRALGAPEVLTLPADVGKTETVEQAVARATARLGPLDAVVNCAGVVAYGRVEVVPPDVYERVLRTNTLGSVNVARAVLPQMRERGQGHLILLGSLIGHLAPPFMGPYAISKWAVRELARILTIENRDRPGVHVSYVAPGGVDTPIYRLGANYMGHVGRPPPPVMSPEKVAGRIMGLFSHPRRSLQIGVTNPVFSLGFTLFPRLYDAIVTPVFEVSCTDAREAVGPTTGNVFTSADDGYRMHGEHGNPLGWMAAALAHRVRRRRGLFRGS